MYADNKEKVLGDIPTNPSPCLIKFVWFHWCLDKTSTTEYLSAKLQLSRMKQPHTIPLTLSDTCWASDETTYVKHKKILLFLNADRTHRIHYVEKIFLMNKVYTAWNNVVHAPEPDLNQNQIANFQKILKSRTTGSRIHCFSATIAKLYTVQPTVLNHYWALLELHARWSHWKTKSRHIANCNYTSGGPGATKLNPNLRPEGNWPQLVITYFSTFGQLSGRKKITKAAYHSETNIQVEGIMTY